MPDLALACPPRAVGCRWLVGPSSADGFDADWRWDFAHRAPNPDRRGHDLARAFNAMAVSSRRTRPSSPELQTLKGNESRLEWRVKERPGS